MSMFEVLDTSKTGTKYAVADAKFRSKLPASVRYIPGVKQHESQEPDMTGLREMDLPQRLPPYLTPARALDSRFANADVDYETPVRYGEAGPSPITRFGRV